MMPCNKLGGMCYKGKLVYKRLQTLDEFGMKQEVIGNVNMYVSTVFIFTHHVGDCI